MVLVIRLRPRQIERFILVSLIILLVCSNIFMYFYFQPGKDCVSVVESPTLEKQESTTQELESGGEYEVLNLTELEEEVDDDASTEETTEDETEDTSESTTEEVDTTEDEEEETTTTQTSSTIDTGVVVFQVDDITWNIDDSRDDFAHLERLSFTIENGLDVALRSPRIKVYLYDSNDPFEIKNSYYTIDLEEMGIEIAAGERWIDNQYVWNPNSKKGMSGFSEIDIQKTVKAVFVDDGTDTSITDTVRETPSD